MGTAGDAGASRRRHCADLKAKVLASCREPGASIAAVALLYGLNARLFRKSLVGRGLKRKGIPGPVDVKTSTAAIRLPAAASMLAVDTHSLPIELAVPGPGAARCRRLAAERVAAGVPGGPFGERAGPQP
jgi:transposase-like protein